MERKMSVMKNIMMMLLFASVFIAVQPILV